MPNNPTTFAPTAFLGLLSGGLDSTAALAMAMAQGSRCEGVLTFDYGQRAAQREIQSASRIAAHLGVPHRILSLPWFSQFSAGGALLSQGPLPRLAAEELDDPKTTRASARAVWVPNRNGTFLEIAAGFAENAGVQAVVVGFNREEAATFADNSVEYLNALTNALRYSTANGVQILSPTATLDKTQIVREIRRLGFPLGLIWSCYEGAAQMCGVCESCLRLKRALRENSGEKEIAFANASL